MMKEDRFLARAAALANLMLVAVAIGSALVFCFFFYHYGWTGQRSFSSWRGVIVYYVAPALLVLLALVALRLKADHKVNLAIVGVTLVLSVYVGEVALRLMEPPLSRARIPIMIALQASENKQALAARLSSEFGVPIDTRDRLEVITELRAKGIDAVPAVIPRYQLYHREQAAQSLLALGGIANKLTVLCNESGQQVSYESDEQGFRNPKGLSQRGAVDIVALGDSFTQGYCVPTGKDFVDLIRERHPATVNLGMAGEGPLLMLATLKEYGAALRPKLVLWFYFEGNDLWDLQEESQSALLMRYLEDGFGQNLRGRQDEVDRALLALVEKEKAVEFARREAAKRNRPGVAGKTVDFLKLPLMRARLGLLKATGAEEVAVASQLKDMKLTMFHDILSRAKASVGAWGGKLYFVYLPNWTRFDADREGALDQRMLEGRRDAVLKTVSDLEIPVIDVLPAFAAGRDPMSLFPFRAPGHYAENGHRLVADAVLEAIAVNGIASAARPSE